MLRAKGVPRGRAWDFHQVSKAAEVGMGSLAGQHQEHEKDQGSNGSLRHGVPRLVSSEKRTMIPPRQPARSADHWEPPQ